jgi:hypothetical protein
VFPILFACVVGRASHAILVWRLGRGEKIGTLDMLASSTSLTNTFTSQLKLRILSILGIGLLALWTLSPFGGQACLRQMSTSEAVTTERLPFAYFAPEGNLEHVEMGSTTSQFAIIDGTFISALLASAAIKASSLDPWGNIKVPKIEDYENTTVSDGNGWFDHDVNSTTNVYASLVGVPLAWTAAPSDASFDMIIETAYLSLDCPIVNGSRDDLSQRNVSCSGATSAVFLPETNGSRNREDATLKPMNFTYLDWGMTGVSQCLLATTYIEARVQCSSVSACGVSRLRRSRLDHPVPGFTLLDTPSSGAFQNTDIFFQHFIQLMAGHPSQASPVQNYLIIPDNPVPYVMESENHIPSNEVFATRLGQLMNGYWSCLQGYYTITAGITFDPDKSSQESYNTSSLSNGSYSTRENVIQAHYAWVVTLTVASMAMIIASLVSPLAKYFQKSPDLMLNISSLATRDSLFVALPSSGSFLGASDRARLVKDIRVRFGNVKADADVGRLAIGTLDLPGVPGVMPVRRKRLYM